MKQIKNNIQKFKPFIKKLIPFVIFIVIAIILTILYFTYRTKPIYIAVAGTMSGAQQENGLAMLKGVDLYLDQVNKQGGVNNRPIYRRKFDDRHKLIEAMKRATEIEADKEILLVLGHYYSNMSIAAGRVYRKSGIPAITASATAGAVTEGNNSYFRVVTNNTFQGKFIANYILKTLNQKSAIIIHNTDSYGMSLNENFQDAAEDIGLKINKIWSFNPESKQLNGDITKIVAELRSLEEPGVIFLATSSSEGVQIISSLKYPGTNYTVIGPDSFSKANFIQKLNQLPQEQSVPGYYSNDIYAVTPFLFDIANEKALKFKHEFIKKYKQQPSWISTCYYDAAHIAVEAIKKIGIQKETNGQRDRKEIREYLSTIRSMEDAVKGITGYMYFDKNGDINRPMAVGVYKNQSLMPAFFQYQVVQSKDSDKNLKKMLDGELMQIEDKLMGKTRVVYTGMTINSISDINPRQGTYTIDYYLWFRYGGNFDATYIEFINSVEPITLGQPIVDQKIDDTTIRAYHLRTKFKTDFDFHKYPFDSHWLKIQFRHAKRTRQEVIYVVDALGMPDSIKKTDKEKIDLNSIGWQIEGQPNFYQNTMSNQSSFGLPEYFDFQNIISYSQFNAEVKIKRKGWGVALRNFFPISSIIIILYTIYFVPYGMMRSRIWVTMAALISNSTYHIYLWDSLSLDYTTTIEYAIFALYGLIVLSAIISTAIFILRRKGLHHIVPRITLTGQILYPVVIVISTILIINATG